MANPADGMPLRLVAGESGQRLDQFVAGQVPALSRTGVQRLIKAGQVKVNDRPVKASYRLVAGEVVTLVVPAVAPEVVLPEDIPLEVLYVDTDLVALNKPAGMVVHPAFGNRQGTVVNAALARWPEMAQVGPEGRYGVVHRLDKDTSGVLLMARHATALAHLQAQFKARSVYKRYLALVEGIPASERGVIEAPIGRDPARRKRMAVVRDGRPAVTHYAVLENLGDHVLLSLELHTGRTHQARVHLAWLGHPVVGDRVYGFRKQRLNLKRLFLHAAELHVSSPSTGERLKFIAPLPPALEDMLSQLRREVSSPWE